jgi:hypothetical protein
MDRGGRAPRQLLKADRAHEFLEVCSARTPAPQVAWTEQIDVVRESRVEVAQRGGRHCKFRSGARHRRTLGDAELRA